MGNALSVNWLGTELTNPGGLFRDIETRSTDKDAEEAIPSAASSKTLSVNGNADDSRKQNSHEIPGECPGSVAKVSLPVEKASIWEDEITPEDARSATPQEERAKDSSVAGQDTAEAEHDGYEARQEVLQDQRLEAEPAEIIEIGRSSEPDPAGLSNGSKQDKSDGEQDDPRDRSMERTIAGQPESLCHKLEQEIPAKSSPAPKRRTGAAFLRKIFNGRRDVHSDSSAARLLHAIYKSPNRVCLLDRLRESDHGMECLNAVWKYTENLTAFEKRAIRFINILRMRSSRLDLRTEHLSFWMIHLDNSSIPIYLTGMALKSSLSIRAASAYGWLLSELLKLDKSVNARFYQQCSKEPKIRVLLQGEPEEMNVMDNGDIVTISYHCDDIADFKELPLSRAEMDWRMFKMLDPYVRHHPEVIDIMDTLMTLTGLESVKQFFMDTIEQYTLAGKHSVKKRQILNIAFTGNPGVGKTQIARLYSQFLNLWTNLHESSNVREENGLELLFEDYSTVMARTGDLHKGVIMIDEVTKLDQGSGKRALILVNNMEKKSGHVHYILTGPTDSMQSFCTANIRFQSLLPHNINIDDHTIAETFNLLREEIKVTWDGSMKVEGGELGLLMRIVARRLSKGRGCGGFGNFHLIQKFLAKVWRRHASRIAMAKKGVNNDVDEMLLTRDDLLGPPPDKSVKNGEAWKTLHEMIGLQKVKQAVESLVERARLNYERELNELPILDTNLNRLFLGNPGTGKTTVAKLYAEIMAGSGILSSSEVVLKTPVDFTSQYIGETAVKTKELLESARGKVLVIDEAYMMYPENDGSVHSIHDAAIDTIVSDVQGVAGEDRAVLLLGYRDKMERMLSKSNPGLERRFPLSTTFLFEDYTRPELLEIFHKKVKKQGLTCTPQAVEVAMDLLDKAKRRPNFGNAGEVENVLSKAKQQASLRLHNVPTEAISVSLVLEPEDFDPEYGRSDAATANIASLFQDMLESQHLVAKLQAYATTCENLRVMNIPPTELIPFSFVFKGPPGTFKTSAARAFGKVFYDMGLLSDSSVIECSVTDLVAEYCGQTGVKTREVLDQAIGKVLLIDEAYRLVEMSKFGEEAIGELIDAMTKPKYRQKIVIILAGDEAKMNRFMLKYHHLRSRFAEDIIFKSLGVEKSYELLIRSVSLGNKLPIELESDIERWEARCKKLLRELISLPTWGNGRDVADVLGKRLINRVMSRPLKVNDGQTPRLVCGGQDIHDELRNLYNERRALTTQQYISGDRISYHETM